MTKAHELALNALRRAQTQCNLRSDIDCVALEAIAALEQEQAAPVKPSAWWAKGQGGFWLSYESIPPSHRSQVTELFERAAPQPPSAQPASTALVTEADLPPLPEPVDYALFAGVAMQGSEIRPLSNNYEPGCAQYTAEQMRQYALATFRSLSTEPGK